MLTFDEFKNGFDKFSVNPLAAGGQKVVYKASHPLHGEVVVKILKEKDARTGREIQIVRANDFRAVPKIYDVVDIEYQGGCTEAIVEQLIEGEGLREIIDSGNAIVSMRRRISFRSLLNFWSKSLISESFTGTLSPRISSWSATILCFWTSESQEFLTRGP